MVSVSTQKSVPQQGARVDTATEVSPPQAKPNGPIILEVRDLGKTFRSGFLRRPQRGIQGVSFSVEKGSVLAILGHNGAGKTTTINCILDLVHADTGEVRIFGIDHRDQRSRMNLGYLPERPYFFEHLTGRELLKFYADLLGVDAKAQPQMIDGVLEKTGMSAHAGRRLRKYSKGMLQRIGLAQALLGDPQLLILDEPMSGLDPVGRRQVRDLLLELKNQGKTIILSTHIVPDVETLADTVAVLREGKLVLTQDLTQIGSENSYLVKTKSSQESAQVETHSVSYASVLRDFLNQCHEEGREIVAVEPCGRGWEDLFLEALGQKEEGR